MTEAHQALWEIRMAPDGRIRSALRDLLTGDSITRAMHRAGIQKEPDDAHRDRMEKALALNARHTAACAVQGLALAVSDDDPETGASRAWMMMQTAAAVARTVVIALDRYHEEHPDAPPLEGEQAVRTQAKRHDQALADRCVAMVGAALMGDDEDDDPCST